MSRPRFVVVEALDGVGKTTLVAGLARAWGGVRSGTPGAQLQDLRGPVVEALEGHPLAPCLFYAASVVAQGRRAREAADRGKTVIVDRYWLSTSCYARARGVRADLDGIAAAVPSPDATVWLTLEESERRRRLADRGMSAADRETLDPVFRERVLHESRRARGPLALTAWVDVTGLNPVQVVRAVADALG